MTDFNKQIDNNSDSHYHGQSNQGDFYENLLKMVPDAILIHTNGKFIFSNKAGLNLFGAKNFEELAQYPVIHYVHPDFRELVKNRIKNMQTERMDAIPAIEKLIRLDGSVITVEVEGKLIKYNDLDANLLVCRDLTQILSDQQKLKESERRNSAILLALPDLMFILDKKGMILDFNASDESELYLPKENIIGSKLISLFPEKTVDLMLSTIKHTLNSKEKTIFEYQLLISENIKTYEARFIYYSENKVMALVRDITKEKEAEKDHLRMLRIDSIGLLAGGIAHDFNNILMKILGNINLISLEENNPNTIKFLKDVENATYQATKLTNQLLTFAKGGEPVTKPESIKEIIEESISLFMSGSKSKVITHYSENSESIHVEAEAGQISQVINNLVLNADQSMPEGGIIDIEIESTKLKTGQYPAIKGGNYVKIAVIDQGIGIREEIKERIFEPYFTTKKDGNGLGLTICYSIVKRHGGYIDIQSDINKGSSFIVYLPVSRRKTTKKQKTSKSNSSFKGKVLIMDDSPDIQQITGKYLEYLGFEYEIANDGAQAIEKYKNSTENPYKFVIMDLTIPGGMGGKKALEELLKIDTQVKAIVSSGYSNDPVIANYKKYGFKGILPKPYAITDLKNAINQIL